MLVDKAPDSVADQKLVLGQQLVQMVIVDPSEF
jgi:hypothetical protein